MCLLRRMFSRYGWTFGCWLWTTLQVYFCTDSFPQVNWQMSSQQLCAWIGRQLGQIKLNTCGISTWILFTTFAESKRGTILSTLAPYSQVTARFCCDECLPHKFALFSHFHRLTQIICNNAGATASRPHYERSRTQRKTHMWDYSTHPIFMHYVRLIHSNV